MGMTATKEIKLANTLNYEKAIITIIIICHEILTKKDIRQKKGNAVFDAFL